VEEVRVVEIEAIVDVKSGLTRGWSGPLKVAAAQPQAVRRTAVPSCVFGVRNLRGMAKGEQDARRGSVFDL
jgi:hypothetical protein